MRSFLKPPWGQAKPLSRVPIDYMPSRGCGTWGSVPGLGEEVVGADRGLS